jgi:pSer/pThr/pTyr-binding forkhead associated (FHA) protein
VIICSRCGKENQKHYKFCLGCGAKLEAAPAPVEAVKPAPGSGPERAAPSALEVAKTAAPPSPYSFSPAGASAAAMPAASPSVSPAAGLAAVAASPAADAPFASSPSGLHARSGLSSARVPTPSPVLAPPLATVPADGAAMGRDMIPCPKCGKPVVATYAFCGSCGQRLKPSAGAAAAAAAPVAKTMYMASSGAPAKAAAPRGHLTLIRPDGTEGGVHALHDGENLIGRGQGSLFDADPYLSPRHAEFVFTDEGLVVRDLRSLNGVFVKLVQEEHLESGDIVRIGQELLRFDVISPATPLEDGTEVIGTPNPGYWGRISVIVGRDVDGPAFPLFDEAVVLGRERGDILFPEDGYVSGTHAQLTLRDGQVYLSDLGSSNGTFFRIRGSRVVGSGSLLLMGQQLFRASFR